MHLLDLNDDISRLEKEIQYSQHTHYSSRAVTVLNWKISQAGFTPGYCGNWEYIFLIISSLFLFDFKRLIYCETTSKIKFSSDN